MADSSSSGAILNFDSALPDLAVDLKLTDSSFLMLQILTEMILSWWNILIASAWLNRYFDLGGYFAALTSVVTRESRTGNGTT